ncbi:MAG: sensor histidine kinase [Ignavibacteriales bacterium]
MYSLLKSKALNSLAVDELKFIYAYRYFSFIVTSIIYLVGRYKVPIAHKLVVVGCLGIAVLLLNYIYSKNENVLNIVKWLIIIESICNVLILIPTGGMDSPYIWYSINSVLITAYYLSLRYFCIIIAIYAVSSTVISFAIFNISRSSIFNYLQENANLIMSYLLIVTAILAMMKLAKRLREDSTRLFLVNNELKEANKIIDESMEQFTALYQSIHTLTNVRSIRELAKIMARYTREITNTALAFISVASKEAGFVFEVNGSISDEYHNFLNKKIKKDWDYLMISENVSKYFYMNQCFLVTPIKSTYEAYGILGIKLSGDCGGFICKEIENQIKFLASLTSILLERIKIDEINKLLVISEEQNRIANEIHDSVSQRLFFISSKLHSLSERDELKKYINTKDELRFIQDSLSSAMRELREVIYSYCDKKSGLSKIEEKIRKRIKEISVLNDVNIKFDIVGSMELISYELKKVLYRILCEALGNAIRHGKSNNIDIKFNIDSRNINIGIIDDGIGFDIKNKSNMGLGIKNLNNLVHSFNGKILIKSQLCKGTCINIELPSETVIRKEQVKVI